MIIIAHRGNLNGPENREHNINQLEFVIKSGFNVEIDIRLSNDNCFYIGHDEKKHKIELNWIIKYKNYLWIHCKDNRSFIYFNSNKILNFNYFWHDKDEFTLTSRGFIWAYPSSKIFQNAINVKPEINIDDNTLIKHKPIFGICTDFPLKYKRLLLKETK